MIDTLVDYYGNSDHDVTIYVLWDASTAFVI